MAEDRTSESMMMGKLIKNPLDTPAIVKSDVSNGFQERESLRTTGTSLAEPYTHTRAHVHAQS